MEVDQPKTTKSQLKWLKRLPCCKELKRVRKLEFNYIYDILPNIRKTGKYEVVQDSYMIADPIERAKRWIEKQFYSS